MQPRSALQFRPQSLATASSLLLLLLSAAAARANVTLASPFTDHMVLQRNMPVPVWGTAAVGEAVTVTFAGQSKNTVADAAGKWRVTLDPLTTNAVAAVLTAKGANTITRQDVLVGEVWLCAGQSNMLGSMPRFEDTTFGSNPSLAETKAIYDPELATTTPGIRLFRSGGAAPTDSAQNLWAVSAPASLKDTPQGFSAAGYFFAKGLYSPSGLTADQSVPIGMMEAAVGGTAIETWTAPFGANYQALVQPLATFAMRGVIWYQGESNLINSVQGDGYDVNMETLVQGWRSAWGQTALPFYYVQLPRLAYTTYSPDSVMSSQALGWFRDLQTQAQRIPDTGMIITSDLVDTADEIHPPNKWDIGQRLALLALAKTYGQSTRVYSGPVYRSMTRRGDKLVLTFDHVGSGLTSSGLKDFTVAGPDQEFLAATAVIEGPDKVVVSSYAWQPMAVRHGWQELTTASLFNVEGLPAGPFRTDTWTRPTDVTIEKANNSNNVNQATSWLGGAAPDADRIAFWNSKVLGTNSVALGANSTWGGIKIVNPKGLVTIQAGNTLSLGDAGIDMIGALQNLTISSGLTILPGTNVWNIATSRTLTLNTGVFTRNPGATLSVQGSGSVDTTNIANDATGIVGPWANYGINTTRRYARVSAGKIVGYTGTTVADGTGMIDTTGTANYEVSVAATGTLGAGASFHTFRYSGTGGTMGGAFAANGILNCGTGSLRMNGAATIGASRELVVNTANGTTNLTGGDVTLAGIISNHSSGASALVKQGGGTLTLSVANSFSGGSWINEGEIYYVLSGGLGTGPVAVASGAKITFRPGGAALANALTIAGNALSLSGASPVLSGAMTLSGDATASTGNTANQNLTLNGPINLNGHTLTMSTASSAAQNWVINGSISGSGGVTHRSGTSTSSTLKLSGSNTFTGVASVTGSGALALNHVNALQNSTLNTGSAGAQKVTFVLAGTNTYNLGGLQGADDLAMGVNSLSIGANNANTAYTGALSGTGGVVKTGVGTLVLAGSNTYSGTTTVSAGTLVCNGSALTPQVTVAANGTLGGGGTISGSLVVQGSLTPGDLSGVGALTAQQVSLSAGGSLKVQISADGSTATGLKASNLLLDAAAVLAVSNPTNAAPANGTRYAIATYSGTWNGVPFAGAPEGSTVTRAGIPFVIHYATPVTGGAAVTLTVAGGASSAYANWATAHGLSQGDAAMDADPDGDGDSNYLEFSLNADPRQGASGSRSRIFGKVHPIAGSNAFTLTVAARSGAVFAAEGSAQAASVDGLVYRVLGSGDLVQWTQVAVSELNAASSTEVQNAMTPALPALENGWAWHTFRLAGGITTPGQGFMRLEVSAP